MKSMLKRPVKKLSSILKRRSSSPEIEYLGESHPSLEQLAVPASSSQLTSSREPPSLLKKSTNSLKSLFSDSARPSSSKVQLTASTSFTSQKRAQLTPTPTAELNKYARVHSPMNDSPVVYAADRHVDFETSRMSLSTQNLSAHSQTDVSIHSRPPSRLRNEIRPTSMLSTTSNAVIPVSEEEEEEVEITRDDIPVALRDFVKPTKTSEAKDDGRHLNVMEEIRCKLSKAACIQLMSSGFD